MCWIILLDNGIVKELVVKTWDKFSMENSVKVSILWIILVLKPLNRISSVMDMFVMDVFNLVQSD